MTDHALNKNQKHFNTSITGWFAHINVLGTGQLATIRKVNHNHKKSV